MNTIAYEHGFKDDMLAPSKKFIARAIPIPGGYIAEFSIPGLVPAYVGVDQNDPDIFETAEEAENAARKAMMGIINKPRERQARGKNERYRKLSGPEFAVLLAESGLGMTLFAYLYGTSPDRVQSWIDGLDNVPHPARLLLEIFKRHPEMVDIAEEITAAVTTERRPQGG